MTWWPGMSRATTVRRAPAFVLAPVLVVLALASMACTDDPDEADAGLDLGGTEVATAGGIDRESLLGELSEVRNLFAATSPLSADLIADVSYEDQRLSVTLAEETEGVEQAEQVCRDLSEAIQLTNLSITVDGPDGSQLASCEFGQ